MRILTAGLALLTLSAAGFSQEPKTQIKRVPIEYTNPASGPAMFKNYCAACHGLDAKGRGPAAAALKKPPANLTLLSKNNNGKFPALVVENFIKGDSAPEAHGSRDMPMWGSLFDSVSSGQSVVDIRIRSLKDYIQSIQEK